MKDFKTAIEALRLEKLKLRFSDNNEAWINKFWYEIAIKYTKGKSAPKCEKNIVEFLKLSNHQAEKISVSGRSIDKSKVVTDVIGRKRTIGSRTWIPSTSTKGSADISATIYGLSVKIEVKLGKDKQSENQKIYEGNIKGAGGIYFIAKDEDDFLTKYLEIIQLPQMVLMKEFNL